MFFGDWLQRRAMLSPNKFALLDAVNRFQQITFADWNCRANRHENFIQNSLKICKGGRVSIYSLNRVEYLDALFAYNKFGTILQTINWRLKPLELEV